MPRKTGTSKRSIQRRNRKIRLANEAFNALPPHTQRIQIARDVLAQLQSGRFTAKKSVYIQADKLSDQIRISDNEVQLQPILQNLESCNVCALGGMLACLVEKFDNFNVGQATDLGSEYGYRERSNRVEFKGVYQYMLKFFSRKQLFLIESAFEATPMKDTANINSWEYTHEELSAALAFGRLFNQYDELNLRLTAIMENIVANNGEFVPSIQPVKEIAVRWVTPNFTA